MFLDEPKGGAETISFVLTNRQAVPRPRLTTLMRLNMSKVLAFLNEQDGASAAEYALILAIVGAAIAGAAIFLGNTIATAVNSAASCISSSGTSGC